MLRATQNPTEREKKSVTSTTPKRHCSEKKKKKKKEDRFKKPQNRARLCVLVKRGTGGYTRNRPPAQLR